MAEDLHFWMQPQIFTKLQEHKANTHVNASFDEQQEQMMTGEWEEDEGDLVEVVTKEH